MAHKPSFADATPEGKKNQASAALKLAQTAAFAAPKGSPEAAKHFKARDAASRVVDRLANAGKGAERSDATVPGKKETAAQRGKRRRKPIADRTTKKSQLGLDAVLKAAQGG